MRKRIAPSFYCNIALTRSRRLLVEILLEAREDLADLFRPAKIGHGVGNGVVIFEPEQRRQLFLVQFLHADAHVVRQHEIEKRLLLAVELRADTRLWRCAARSSRVSGGKA